MTVKLRTRQRDLESVSESAVKLSEFESRQGRHGVSELAFKHQREEIATDPASTRQAIFRSEHDLSCESENFSVNGRADHRRHVLMFCDKRSGYFNVKAGLSSTFGDSLARSINLASPHERACSAINARASRASRFRCLRNTAPSLDSLFRLHSLSAYWRSAARTTAVRLLRLDEVSASSSRSFEVASSIAILFIRGIISAVLDYAQGLRSVDSNSDWYQFFDLTSPAT